ncbi:MAG: restriction endonuclease, partial [Streptococcaceae bacterium]|nr:restriction endonuclease [Streptococcaceae bacterium]
MVEYEKLKKSDNGMPTWDSFIPIVLEVIPHKESWSGISLKRAAVADILHLPENLKIIKYKDTDYETALENRAGFALSLLTNAGLVSRPERGQYISNSYGRKKFEELGDRLDYKMVKTEPLYIKYEKEKQERTQKSITSAPFFAEEAIFTPEEQMTEIERKYNSDIAAELLSKIRESDPTFFEGLVVNLLVKMGYQGKNGEAIVTKRSGDGGIDGIINQDPLGTSTVYIQAKRYKEGNNVQVG